MTGGESSYEDVNAPVVGLIVLEVGVDDFERLVVGESDLTYVVKGIGDQPRSQGLFPGLWVGREKALASAGHVFFLHPEILGVIN